MVYDSEKAKKAFYASYKNNGVVEKVYRNMTKVKQRKKLVLYEPTKVEIDL